jgi:glutamine cyclotransferase
MSGFRGLCPLYLAGLLVLLSPLATWAAETATAPVHRYRVVASYPHDPKAFTQGLSYEGGLLYEGTGMRGRSTVRRVDLATGKVLASKALPGALFGEGIALCGDRLVQLTWRAHKGFVYDKKSLQRRGGFAYDSEGWGLTRYGKRLVMSDGSATLRFLDPRTFAVTGSVVVRDGDHPVMRLNELEAVQGKLLANVWRTDRIAVIDPASGRVTAWIDLAGLLKPEDRRGWVDVLNGIAYDPAGDRLFVTGKLWPKVFQIDVVPPL